MAESSGSVRGVFGSGSGRKADMKVPPKAVLAYSLICGVMVVLAVILAIVLMNTYTFVKKEYKVIAYREACTTEDIGKYNEIIQSRAGMNMTALKELKDSIVSREWHDSDPNCVYLALMYYTRDMDLDNVFGAGEKYISLVESGYSASGLIVDIKGVEGVKNILREYQVYRGK